MSSTKLCKQRSFWGELRYVGKAMMCLQKNKPSWLGFVLLFFGIGGFASIYSMPLSNFASNGPILLQISYAALKILDYIACGIGIGIFMSILNEINNFETYEKFTIYFLDCLKSVNEFLTKSIREDNSYPREKFCRIHDEFINYYEELILYTQYINLSPSTIKEIIEIKRYFDKFQTCEGCDFKMVLHQIKEKSDTLRDNCFSKYGFIYEHEKTSTPEA